MGKNKARAKKKNLRKSSATTMPFVSVCTPTFNRRPFIGAAIKCFESQDYPKNRMEWIIYDDGTDPIEDLVKDVPCVRYFKTKTKLSLGSKRNYLHHKAKGDIVIYMDDDDYYPPTRVSHAVEVLTSNPEALAAGCSELHMYFSDLKKIYQFGPYHATHATAASFALKRELFESRKYDTGAFVAEEKQFLANYSVPFAQLDSKKTILAMSHGQNSFDKMQFVKDTSKTIIKDSPYNLDAFIADKETQHDYTELIPNNIKSYELGTIKHKPDVTKYIDTLNKTRQKQHRQANASNTPTIEMLQPDGTKVSLNHEEIVHILQMQQRKIQELTSLLNKKENNKDSELSAEA